MIILVVDDSKVARQFIKKDLQVGDYTILEAKSGDEAIAMVKKHSNIHLITMDVNMSGMNGFETALAISNILSQRKENYYIPIVFVTANDTAEDRIKAFQVGATNFIVKPFKKGVVLKTIELVLTSDDQYKTTTALVVEDNSIHRMIATTALLEKGVTVLEAKNGKEALPIIEANRDKLDLILTDLEMPEMNGAELCHAIRHKLFLKELPIIVVSGHEDKETIISIYKSGATDYLTKPFLKEELLARIDVHLQNQLNIKILEKQLAELNRLSHLKDDFLSICAHDLRSPLSGIMGFARLLLKEQELSYHQKECLVEIDHSGQFLLHLINDLLDLSKIEEQSHSMNMSELSLAQIVEVSASSLKHTASPKNITITIYNHAKQDIILGNFSALARIFNNLLSNAIKFTPPGGQIQIGIEHVHRHEITVSVIDTGMGIKPENITKLFDRFSKLSRRGTSGEKGTGLGLTITKELVEQHHGRIDVHSKSGKGSRFAVTFPLIQ